MIFKCYGPNTMNDIINNSYRICKNISEKELSYEKIENGIVVPFENDNFNIGVVFRENGTISELSKRGNIINIYGKNINNIFNSNFNNKTLYLNNIKLISEKAVFMGIGYPQAQYGETLSESIDRLWYLLDKDINEYKIVFIRDISQDCLNLLKLFGIEEKNIIIAKEPLKFKEVVVPEKSFKLDLQINIKYKAVINKIKEKVKPSKYKKVYFSRNKLSQKRTLFNDPIDNTFKINGYKIFYPEELSLYEKISILKGTEYFVGAVGSNQMHMIFANDNLENIIINRNDIEYYNFNFDLLNNSRTTIICANNNFLPPAVTAGPFLIGATEYLFKFFDDNNFKYNKKDFMYEYNQIIDYIFTWSKVYKRMYIRAKEYLNNNVKEISKDELSDKLIDLQHNSINESTIPIKTFLFIGKTTKIGSFQMDNFFEIHIFGLNIIKIKLNHELNLKTRMLHSLVKLIPISSLRQKLRNKYHLPTPPFWKEQEEIEFSNLYNKYKNEKKES
ncbi:glycosyltransferase family 61 protein [uncultured Brachyspira sp.]|uniref:glycosyltransferase 61 family protein n=1 Tax=uncultured Brachyspira sp. TaxID=221953 RepID=UPI00260F10C1|nr:glycosyltransferase family 61 protein [uncultured Brachyspira sp.]